MKSRRGGMRLGARKRRGGRQTLGARKKFSLGKVMRTANQAWNMLPQSAKDQIKNTVKQESEKVIQKKLKKGGKRRRKH